MEPEVQALDGPQDTGSAHHARFPQSPPPPPPPDAPLPPSLRRKPGRGHRGQPPAEPFPPHPCATACSKPADSSHLDARAGVPGAEGQARRPEAPAAPAWPQTHPGPAPRPRAPCNLAPGGGGQGGAGGGAPGALPGMAKLVRGMQWMLSGRLAIQSANLSSFVP